MRVERKASSSSYEGTLRFAGEHVLVALHLQGAALVLLTLVTPRPIAGTLDHHIRVSHYPRKTGTLLPFGDWEVPSLRLQPDSVMRREVSMSRR